MWRSIDGWRGGIGRRGLIFLFFIQMLINPSSFAEIINKPKITLLRTTHTPQTTMCFRRLGGDTQGFRMLLRMEVRPIGPGNDKIHVAGSVDVPTDQLTVDSGWTRLLYECVEKNDELVLRVMLNNTELPYKPIRTKYSSSYELNVIKLYLKGHLEILDEECPQDLTTEASSASTPQETVKIAPPVRVNTNPSPKGSILQVISRVSESPDSSTVTTVPLTIHTEASKVENSDSWLLVMGSVGSVSILIIVVVVVVGITVAVTIFLIRRRRRSSSNMQQASNVSKNYDPFVPCKEPLMPQESTSTSNKDSNIPKVTHIYTKDSVFSPINNPPPPSPSSPSMSPVIPVQSPNYYGK